MPILVDSTTRRSSEEPATDSAPHFDLETISNVESEPTFDLNKITKHPALTVMNVDGANELVITLDLAKQAPEKMKSLSRVLPEYAPHITHVNIRIHAPHPHLESWGKYNRRVAGIKSMIYELKQFDLQKLDVVFELDHLNFQQLKLAAGLYGLGSEGWSLAYVVADSEEDEKVTVTKGSEYGRRLRGVYRTEFKK